MQLQSVCREKSPVLGSGVQSTVVEMLRMKRGGLQECGRPIFLLIDRRQPREILPKEM
ncbi:hypothetical protein [uncultured Desulfobacter sp.]|uniref:hypothetical protein n=1 Tax=uncultured Desulfobacter sp. TaxID=240139 RepID=UPI0029F57C40|nr:hypothetical protein [uncultured Desulfobacter sp.]